MPSDETKPIGSRLVLKVKYLADGRVDRHKARLVALGYQQRPGFDFWSNFSPMASLTAVRMVCSHAVENGWDLLHCDVPNAFTQATIDTKIHFTMPAGVDIEGMKDDEVLRLRRALYGLKQSPQLFNKLLNNCITTELGFKQINADTCVYHFRGEENGEIRHVYVCSEVDDLVVTGNHLSKIEALREAVIRHWGSTKQPDWGPMKSFLGIDVNYDKSNGTCTFGVPYKIQKVFEDHPFLSDIASAVAEDSE